MVPRFQPRISTPIDIAVSSLRSDSMPLTLAGQGAEATNIGRPFVICVDAGATKTHAVLLFTDTLTVEGSDSFEVMVGCGSCSALGPVKASDVLRAAVVSVLTRAGLSKYISATPDDDPGSATPPPSPISADAKLFDANDFDHDEHKWRQTVESRVRRSMSYAKPLRNCGALWVGLAGINSPAVEEEIKAHVIDWVEPLGLGISGDLYLGNDALLLGAPLLSSSCSPTGQAGKAICLIAGTGSIGFALGAAQHDGSNDCEDRARECLACGSNHPVSCQSCRLDMIPDELAMAASLPQAKIKTPNDLTTLAQAGGWGWLLGDEGSGYHVGLSALRLLLRNEEERARSSESASRRHQNKTDLAPSPLASLFERQACAILGVASVEQLVQATYAYPLDSFKHWVARLCPLVFAWAFPTKGEGGSPSVTIDEKEDDGSHRLARTLVEESANHLADLGDKLFASASNEEDNEVPSGWTLILAGGLFANSKPFVDLLLETWRRKRCEDRAGQNLFASIRVLDRPAKEGAKALAALAIEEGVMAREADEVLNCCSELPHGLSGLMG
ncbi:hypothetical protein BDZ90DRAFT_191270 [Jaminaea rosea]|uniref:Uncharacterized protein n=1 Tax=Jaminaea rosea TaxID=1569628 RepID=A0A316UN67_9BASI|nr:hypothetical protein BDZ90DRAFT_191270 [Jaminaea rosea]PWN26752.1 hypothetical protein BDZ90DRAFT_191270 [Jaminaea rosea]